jgi:arsenate reductase
MLTFYLNPRCKTSQKALKYIKSKGVEVSVIDYLKNPFTEKELTDLLVRLNMRPQEIIRTQEEFYKTNIKGKAFTDWELTRILMENPRLIKRPVIVKGYKAVIGDTQETIDRLLER